MELVMRCRSNPMFVHFTSHYSKALLAVQKTHDKQTMFTTERDDCKRGINISTREKAVKEPIQTLTRMNLRSVVTKEVEISMQNPVLVPSCFCGTSGKGLNRNSFILPQSIINISSPMNVTCLQILYANSVFLIICTS